MDDGQFYVISVTQDGTTITIDVNGFATALTVVVSGAGFDGTISNAKDFIFGAGGGPSDADRPLGDGYEGRIAEFAFWKSALGASDHQVALDYLLNKYNITPEDLT